VPRRFQALVPEVLADLPESRTDDAAVHLNCGMRWSLQDKLILDAALGTRLINDAPDLTATIGLTWAWEALTRKQATQP